MRTSAASRDSTVARSPLDRAVLNRSATATAAVAAAGTSTSADAAAAGWCACDCVACAIAGGTMAKASAMVKEAAVGFIGGLQRSMGARMAVPGLMRGCCRGVVLVVHARRARMRHGVVARFGRGRVIPGRRVVVVVAWCLAAAVRMAVAAVDKLLVRRRVERGQHLQERGHVPDVLVVHVLAPGGHAAGLDPVLDHPERFCRIDL